MQNLKTGILRESKVLNDKRTPLTPSQCRWLIDQYPGFNIYVQASPFRCYKNESFAKEKIIVTNDLNDCQLLLGIKEVSAQDLIPGKTYMFFSHTTKGQIDNMPLLQSILDKKIRLIDYELLVNNKGNRLIGFGIWAGIAGAHYALYMWGNRTENYSLKPACKYNNLDHLKKAYRHLPKPSARVVITGTGRVARGAEIILQLAGLQKQEPEVYLQNNLEKGVYTMLNSAKMYKHKDNRAFQKSHFHQYPDQYYSCFKNYACNSDVLINALFWNPEAPRNFESEDIKDPGFSIQTIADITCDLNGSVPLTIQHTTFNEPVFGFDRKKFVKTAPYRKNAIDIMAINNLPNELPVDSSRDFGETLSRIILPPFLSDPDAPLFKRATLAENGKLTGRFKYLEKYLSSIK